MAVKTFSIRLGSRRNQRPPHQKIRSITTVKATMETRRIGHITGPPCMNLSRRKLPVSARAYKCPPPAGEALSPGLALIVAVTLAPGGTPPGTPTGPAGEVPGAPGGIPAGGG